MNREGNPHLETDLSLTDSGIRRFHHVSPSDSGMRVMGTHIYAEDHAVTQTEKKVTHILRQRYFWTAAVCMVSFFIVSAAGFYLYRYYAPAFGLTVPDYSALDPHSETYWADRIIIDINTARKATKHEQHYRNLLRSLVLRTMEDAATISSSYIKAQAVVDAAITLYQHDVDFIVLDNHLRLLEEVGLVFSLRSRALISQALMYVRLRRVSAALVSYQQYIQFVKEYDLKLNSSVNEEAFFGAVSVLQCIRNYKELDELFELHQSAAGSLGMDVRMRIYRLIAGEQIRIGRTEEAVSTVNRISDPVEWARAWSLLLQYTARPLTVNPKEPSMLALPDTPPTQPLSDSDSLRKMIDRLIQSLVSGKDASLQITLLRNIAGSRLMCDAELYEIFRSRIREDQTLSEEVQRPILKLLDHPESPTIRSALNMPPLPSTSAYQTDTAQDDWRVSDEYNDAGYVDIDSAILYARTDQQWVQALLAVAQGYQSIKWLGDADRVLDQAFTAAQSITNLHIQNSLLMSIAEQQMAIGSIDDAQKTFAAVMPRLNQNQKSDLARLQMIGRLWEDAYQTIAEIEPPQNREYTASFLFQEYIRLHRLDDAEKTLALLPAGITASECQSRLNIAQEKAGLPDYERLSIDIPKGDTPDWERYCIGLIRHGFLRLAGQAVHAVGDEKEHADLQIRIASEYLLLYQAFNDVNDSERTVRQEIQQTLVSLAERVSDPLTQTTMLAELVFYMAEHVQTEADRTEGKYLWTLAMEDCRLVSQTEKKALLFAQLILAKNLLENPNRRVPRPHIGTIPFFNRGTQPALYHESNDLIEECLKMVNALDNPEQQGLVCSTLALALVQIGRAEAARVLLDHTLETIEEMADSSSLTSMLLSTIPAFKAMNAANIPTIYRLAVDSAARRYPSTLTEFDAYDWRRRDSEIESVVRSQMENGFIEDAVESANRLTEPMLRERLLRTAVYCDLGRGNIERAEWIAQRLTVKRIRDEVIPCVHHFKRRSEPAAPKSAASNLHGPSGIE